MSKDWQEDVRKFNEKFDIYIGKEPSFPPEEEEKLAFKLVTEEFIELAEAIAERNLPKIIDSIDDSIYVLLGMALKYGADMNPIWDAIQEANMAKEGGGKRDDGKIMKPEGWVEPPIEEILKAQTSTKELPVAKTRINVEEVWAEESDNEV